MEKMLLSAVVLAASLVSADLAIAQERAGGFTSAPGTDAGVRAAAEFAVSAQSEQSGVKYRLNRIVSAQTQVVAGVNYRLCLKVSSDKKHKQQLIDATVYRDLTPKFSLKEWQVVKTCPHSG